MPQLTAALRRAEVDWPSRERAVALLSGRNFPTEVSHLWIADFILRGISVLVVDCAIRLDVFRLADEALRHDVNPDLLLASVLVQRVFTPYHILEAIGRADRERRPLTVLLAPMKQFFDGDVAEEEGLFLLRRMVARLRSVASPFLVVERDHYSHPSFKAVYPELEAVAASVWRVADRSSSQQPFITGGALWDAQSLPILGSLKR